MPSLVFLWSSPRCLSTAFLRMMIERGDCAVVNEPFSSIAVCGHALIDGEKASDPIELIERLRELSRRTHVFVKETTEYRYDIIDHPDFAQFGRHTFMIRDPAASIASHYAMNPDVTLSEVGYEHQYEIVQRIVDAGHTAPVVEAEKLLADPRGTVRDYCQQVGLPFLEGALTWTPGDRAEWARTRRWHQDAAWSSGFAPTAKDHPVTIATDPRLAAYYRHHLPYYEAIRERGKDAVNQVITHVSEGPGTIDEACARRREEITECIQGHTPGAPLPNVGYTAEEDQLWQTVISKLNGMHSTVACHRYLDAVARLRLPTDRVPTLREVSDGLEGATGFRLLPAKDLVPPRDFYAAFADGFFYSTMYMRCPATPLYSPAPDVLHELVGHAVPLSDPFFADLYRAFGEAVVRTRTAEELEAISRVFWFTMETGLVRELGGLRAYGAALLSSAGELESLGEVVPEEFSIDRMVHQTYDICQYQPVLFVVDSFDRLDAELRTFLDTWRSRKA
ncbi:phenylalanine 4-monooxygenase [Streptosporangium sp. NPDC002721]|uniref:phenylalanine 4-monooxygenase n=1 Tax=Streptosporangium sp. NPDC002721 TaxID=3366188 RepID=UPI003674CCD3